MARGKNAWRVYWREDGKRRFKHFEGAEWAAEKRGVPLYEKPLTVAKELIKELKERGIEGELVSCRWALIQTIKQDMPASGMTWCPFCMKYRKFHLFQVKRKNGLDLQPAVRCPVCYISTDNYWVQRYNGSLNNLTLTPFERARRYPKQ